MKAALISQPFQDFCNTSVTRFLDEVDGTIAHLMITVMEMNPTWK